MTSSLDLHDTLAAASVHAVDLQSGDTVGLDPDQAMPLASVVKLPWAVATHRAADAGEVALTDRLRIDPATATPGPTGVSAWHHEVELSLHDALHLSLAQSDNASADAVVSRVGLARIRAHCVAAGLPASVARHPIRALYDALAEVFPTEHTAQFSDRLAEEPGALTGLAAMHPDEANSASARDLTDLLQQVWADVACSPAGCASLRDSLLRPAAPGRIARGLGSNDLTVANKTGTQLTLRHDVGWVGFPDGRCYVVAVLTRAHSLGNETAHDEAVGSLARQAIRALRA